MNILMQCGHTAHGRDKNGNPVCVICLGIKDEATETVQPLPDLTGRKATCCYGRHGETDSSFDLPFFNYRPEEKTDEYYCGCRGWD